MRWEQWVAVATLVAIILWAACEVRTGRAIDRHRERFAAYRQSCADAFDDAWDDVAALFPPVGVDELAARRSGGGPTT